MLICPHCRSRLAIKDKQYRCLNNHCFDEGRAGDINLLLPHQKRSKNPGDSKEMVTARRHFLSTGVYQPIAERVANFIMRLSQGDAKVIADAGCGEGYYLRQIQCLCYPHLDYFYANGGAFYAWDISKFAVQSAAKQATFSGHWLTASNAAIPLAGNSVDILLSHFGFEVASEFSRVVKSGGYVITLDSGENHLLQLREIIYDRINPFQEKTKLPQESFCLLKSENIGYEITLDATQIQSLMLMTPHLFRASESGKMALAKQTKLTMTVDVILRVYQVTTE